MPRRIRLEAGFAADLDAQVAWLRQRGEPPWIERLAADLRHLEASLAAFPGIGHEVRRRGSHVLRRALLRSAPFVVWYAYDEEAPEEPVTLLRIAHVRQRRPEPFD